MENKFSEDVYKKSNSNTSVEHLQQIKSEGLKTSDLIDQLNFYLDLKDEKIPSLDTYVEMKGIRFSGTITSHDLNFAIKEGFKKYFLNILRSGQKVVKEDFIKSVNNEIAPSKITKIEEIDVYLALVRTIDRPNPGTGPDDGNGKTPQYNYNQIIQKINDKKAELPQEKDAEPNVPELYF